MKRLIFDIESDGLIENATKIHCLCWHDIDSKESGKITTYDGMMDLLYCNLDLTLIGHNIIRYDIPMLEKFLGADLSNVRQVDTLALSWYLYPKRLIHGLEGWGKDFGIEKPPIEIWIDDGTPEFTDKMLHRCSEDVKINTKLFELEIEYLIKLYEGNIDGVNRLINYLGFKFKCAREQEEMKIRVDLEKCKTNLIFLGGEAQKKIDILRPIMPRVNEYIIRSKPKVMFRKGGSTSTLGTAWFELLKKQGLPDYHNGAIKLVKSTKEGNPGSHDQIKEWLYSLGWIPETFKFVRKKIPGTKLTDYSQPARKVAQVGSDDNTGLCKSVKKLFPVEPKLKHLDSLYTINSRIGNLNSFMESVNEEGFLKAEINGFTNTLRFAHKKPIANLPQIPKLYWKEVRECLITPSDQHILCGSDMSGLEDQTKRHYIYFYDPEYVRTMMSPDYDPHLYIAVKAGIITQEEADRFKKLDKKKERKEKLTDEENEFYGNIKGLRLKAKKTNFAAIYGAGAPKIAVTANIPLKEGEIFHKTYWEVNWAVKEIANNAIRKSVNGQSWLFNPISQLWYILKTDKDAFSTLNQGTGAYAFDTWTRYCRIGGHKICLQYHDEHVGPILKGKEEDTKKILLKAIDQTNEELKLNITLGISIAFGESYADIH